MTKIQKKAERGAPAQKGTEKPNTAHRTGSEPNSTELESKPKRKAVPNAAVGPAKPKEAASAKARVVNVATANETAPASPKSTKQDQVLTMLSRAGGVTIDEIMKATGWQRHGVRGFFAGTVRKKLGYELTSEKLDGE
jgi:Protein of unknown function (DUF3489)